jgi:serine/threonine-protein kinase
MIVLALEMEKGSKVPAAGGGSASIAGRYVIGESFASGGTGTVHLGRIVGAGGFSRVVAVKRLFPGIAAHRGFREMLLEEARLVSRIRHPNVVAALDVVEEEQDLYIVMEYVHGPSLAQLLTRARSSAEPIPVEIAAGIVEAVLFGLHAAHEARGEEGLPLGIVHRDVSPQNILVGADGVTRLIDFGIAKAATRMQTTDPGVVKGKLGYMAPEQFLYQPVSRHSDVYAASVVLWEALTNRRLFEGRSKKLKEEGAGSIRQALETKVVPPSHYRSGIDAELDGSILRGLELEPSDRFPTAEAMALALRRAHAAASPVEIARWLERFAPDELELAEERVRLLEQAPATIAPEGSATPMALVDGSATTSRHEPPRKARGARFVGLGALALAAAAAAVILGGKTQRHAAADAVSAPTPAATVAAFEPPSSTVAAPAPVTQEAPALERTAEPASSPARPRRKLAKSPCDPPFTIDANGHKHYHPNCF